MGKKEKRKEIVACQLVHHKLHMVKYSAWILHLSDLENDSIKFRVRVMHEEDYLIIVSVWLFIIIIILQ